MALTKYNYCFKFEIFHEKPNQSKEHIYFLDNNRCVHLEM